MPLTIDELAIIYPDQILLEFSPEESERIWQESQNYSHNAARWNAYLNRLCLNMMINYLTEDANPGESLQISPNLETLSQIWEVVNGSAFCIGETRIILIPTEEIDTEEFQIPQEWVDLPSWVGDYYLAALVEPEEYRIRIWGYTNYQNLKTKADYDECDRIYYLGREFMIEDLNVMWVARQLCPPAKPQVEALRNLSVDEATALVAYLGRSSPYSPRLEVEFEQWGALLENPNLLRMLYQRRLAGGRSSAVVNLLQWLDGIFESGWQTVAEILNFEQVEMGYGFRDSFRDSLILSRGKKFDLGMQVGEESVAFIVILSPATETEIDIRIQVHPMGGQSYLPVGVKLRVMDEFGAEVMDAESRDADNFIELIFSAEVGERFSIVVALREVRVIEYFCLEEDLI